MFAARVETDSISPAGRRLITAVATYPRCVHSELMTHRAFERNAASSRAIPFAKMVSMVEVNPFIPIKWGAEQKGMQTGAEIDAEDRPTAEEEWLGARDAAVSQAESLHRLGIHKSICNRLLEPFAWITTIITATEWENFFRLRCHPDAEIHLQKIAYMLRDAIAASEPVPLKSGEWHTPFVKDVDRQEIASLGMGEMETLSVSAARAARVSYLTHDGVRSVVKDLELFDKLANGSGFGHFSPHGHVAQAADDGDSWSGPLRGYKQFRKLFAHENAATPAFYKAISNATA